MQPWFKGVLITFALYLPSAWWLEHSYKPDPTGPPPSAGIRVRILRSYYAPMTPIAVTARGQVGTFETVPDLNRIEIWEDNRKLGPGCSTINEIVSLGMGRFLVEGGNRFTWSSSDNTDPMTNGRTYWVVRPQGH